MKINDMQMASLTINLASLGQIDLTDNDPEALRTLEYLLEEAHKNVKRALGEEPKHTYAELRDMHEGRH